MDFFTHLSSSTPKWRRGRSSYMEFAFFFLLFCLCVSRSLCDNSISNQDRLIYAKLKTEVIQDNGRAVVNEESNAGTYGQGTRVNLDGPIKGQLVHVHTKVNKSDLGCSILDPEIVPSKPWVALVLRGECNFNDKIYYAAKVSNASAVIIYDFKDSKVAANKELLFDAANGDFIGRYSIERKLSVILT